LLALRARAPLVAAFPLRRADGRHEVIIAGVIEPPARASHAWAEAAMLRVTHALEELVREHPEQWLWMHRRWKQPRAERAEPRTGAQLVAAGGRA
jgi:KDO2-lipid IV(A) lauroyltransferase